MTTPLTAVLEAALDGHVNMLVDRKLAHFAEMHAASIDRQLAEYAARNADIESIIQRVVESEQFENAIRNFTDVSEDEIRDVIRIILRNDVHISLDVE